ncbi:GL20503, partial [Drosophila persimilis]
SNSTQPCRRTDRTKRNVKELKKIIKYRGQTKRSSRGRIIK